MRLKDENGVVKAASKPCVAFMTLLRRECYQFTWPGKTEAKLEARRPCDKTRPHPEKSVDWGTTQNAPRGRQSDALKVMRETYAGKVKLIYIDPPYNTGHDFRRLLAQTHEEHDAQSGEYDGEAAFRRQP